MNKKAAIFTDFPKPAALLLPLALLLLLPACALFRPAPVTLRVPFLAQPQDHCGPAALLMVARYWNLDPDPAAVDSLAFVPALHGTTPELLLHVAPSIGLTDASLLPLAPDDPSPVFRALDAATPLILLLAPPPSEPDPTRGHFLVATGYNPSTRALRVHSGDTPDRWLPASRWLPRLRSTLLLRP